MRQHDIYRKREHCRACNQRSELHCFLSLGSMPLANAFLTSPEQFATEGFFPLDVYFCANCSLVQVLDVVHPEVLFRNYIYVSGTSETISAHYRNYAETVRALHSLQPGDLVIEVASNDGTLLRYFQEFGMRTIGIEPASNVSAVAIRNGIETINDFWSLQIAHQIRNNFGPPRVVIANNVLAHVDDPVEFLRACGSILHDDGIVIIEVPSLLELLQRLEYDTVYHEHLCYFSVTTLMRVCEAAGLSIVDVAQVSVHGGSLRIYAAPARQKLAHSDSALSLSAKEKRKGLAALDSYFTFADGVRTNKIAVRSWFEDSKASGKTIAGYGAPAKGNTLLNYCRIGADLLPYTVDKNTWKVGLYTPGMHIPIAPVSRLQEDQPDYVFLLAWNFAEEIRRQQSELTARGGKFVIPIPQLRIL